MLISHGKWRNGISWEFHTGIISCNELQNITAATVIIFSPNYKKVLLTFNTKRNQWEFPGGKIDVGEGVKEAAIRESFEEGGIVIKNLLVFGYRKVVDITGTINTSTGRVFPNPSFVIYHRTTSNQQPQYPLTALECSRAKYFDIDNSIISSEDKVIIKTALYYKKIPN
jgi:hypothetical protein